MKKNKIRKTGKRSPLATIALVAAGLLITGGAYAGFSQTTATAEVDMTSQQTIDEGQKLFAANCATCHGMNAEGTPDGPSLIGVGAASVHFQVGTGRMPLAFQGPQGMVKPVQFTEEQTLQMAAYVASLAPGPEIPEARYLQADGDAANGSELFRINCAMCHNVAAAGGALTQGKYAPALTGVDEAHIYEAMVTGPQNMPVFSDANLTPQDKADIITYLKYIEKETKVGGFGLGSLGPVAEGLFIWVFGLGAIVALTVWVTAKSN
ncbi:cystathionine beta-lyase [Leucobacter sp. OH2974_COT-288]|uniref:Cytochrome bc1 complex cytochrome c subunit n=1 Tax=Canibacter oris TaxID=1365628 RepID=A0A840DRU2_9MICO|nr:cytochrome c [Canibacter oris]MBB4071866.1 ubiquinol-cytochrome c reductase cytochrome c subunit [Canibacter oris]RRD36272.1 cystathionine beta-lyase [Leucobacter sp. OH2974_COT-288]